MNAQQRVAAAMRRLQKAQAILVCAVCAARSNVEADYDDVMDAVAAMIDEAIAALDLIDKK